MISRFKLIPLLALGLFSVKISSAQNIYMTAGISLNYVNYNPKFEYTVTNSDGTMQKVKSKIYLDSITHKYYLEFEDKKLTKSDPKRKQKIYANQTISISRIKEYSEPLIYGIANDSCWMFKVISGAINAYAYLSGTPDKFDEATIIGIQNGESMSIVPFTPENLKSLIAKDRYAMDYFTRKKYLKALKEYNSNKKLKSSR